MYRCINYFRDKDDKVVGYRIQSDNGDIKDVPLTQMYEYLTQGNEVIGLEIAGTDIKYIADSYDKSLRRFNDKAVAEYEEKAKAYDEFVKTYKCLPADAHYISGNFNREERMELLQEAHWLEEWANRQRSQLIANYTGTAAQKKKIEILNKICKYILDPTEMKQIRSEKEWWKSFDYFVYKMKHGMIDSSYDSEVGWIKRVVERYKNGELSEDKMKAITDFYPDIINMKITAKSLLELSDKLYHTGEFREKWLSDLKVAEKIILSNKLRLDSDCFAWVINQYNNRGIISDTFWKKLWRLLIRVNVGVERGELSGEVYTTLLNIYNEFV